MAKRKDNLTLDNLSIRDVIILFGARWVANNQGLWGGQNRPAPAQPTQANTDVPAALGSTTTAKYRVMELENLTLVLVMVYRKRIKKWRTKRRETR